ncbi:glycosyltransferase family 52 [Aeromonas sobria]|uniref:glycosyltransferase family 52 n=1 Tax=Aeromonas sobria TaxID=646 RepID=UPI003D08D6A1
MDLVICNTPFQVLQIQNMIDKGIINEFELFYFSSKKTDQMNFYFDLLKKRACKSTFYISNKKFPYHILDMRRVFKGRRYRNIYSASVDSVYTHSILSFSHFLNFFSFDDGSANLIENSAYYVDQRSCLKKNLFKLLGCCYDLEKTKMAINCHYTIYKNRENIVSNRVEVEFEFFSRNNIVTITNKKPVANVLLGPVFHELSLSNSDKKSLIKKLSALVKGENCYYIPHPRETEFHFEYAKCIEGLEIAESKILSLLNEYDYINVYGFNSSVQINLSSHHDIRNILLDTSSMLNESASHPK